MLRHGRSGRRQRQGEAEDRAAPGLALDGDRAAHALDDALGDGEAEARAAEPPRRRRIGLLELAKDDRHLLGGDPDAGVRDLELDALADLPDAQQHTACLGELHGIAGEIEKNLLQAAAIAEDAGGHAGADMGRDLDALGMGARGHELDEVLDQRRQREGLLVELDMAGFDLREVEDLVDQR